VRDFWLQGVTTSYSKKEDYIKKDKKLPLAIVVEPLAPALETNVLPVLEYQAGKGPVADVTFLIVVFDHVIHLPLLIPSCSAEKMFSAHWAAVSEKKKQMSRNRRFARSGASLLFSSSRIFFMTFWACHEQLGAAKYNTSICLKTIS